MTQRTSHRERMVPYVTGLSDNDKAVDESLLEDDIVSNEGIRISIGGQNIVKDNFVSIAGCVGIALGSFDTDLHIADPWITTRGFYNPYEIISTHYHDVEVLKTQISQLRDEVTILRGSQTQIVYIEEISLAEAKEKVVHYFEEHSEADLEELMMNLKIPVRILVDVIDELRKEGSLSPAGEE